MRIKKTILKTLCVLTLCLTAVATYGQSKIDSTSFSLLHNTPDTISLQDEFELVYALVDLRRTVRLKKADIQLPTLDDFEVISGPDIVNKTTLINGKYKFERKYTYRLRPKKIGALIIESASITVGDGVLRSDDRAIYVVLEKMFTEKLLAEEVFIKASVSKEKAFIGEGLILEYKLFIPDSVEFRNFQIAEEDEYIAFRSESYFPKEYHPSGSHQLVNGIRYKTKLISRYILFPQLTGSWSLNPIEMELPYKNHTVEPDQPFYHELYTLKKIFRKSQPINIEVQDYPEPIPDAFRGAVDCTKMTLEFDNTLSINNTMDVIINIWSTGDLNRAFLPSLGLEEEYGGKYIYAITDHKEDLVGDSVLYKRQIRYQFNSNVLESENFKPSLTYFDSESETFKILEIKASDWVISSESSEEWSDGIKIKNDAALDKLDNKPRTLDLILLADVSSSMLARDFPPNRLEFLKNTMIENRAVKARSQNTGLITFNAATKVVCPLGSHIIGVKNAIDSLEIGKENDGTSLGLAISVALDELSASSADNKAIVLMTDGESNADDTHPLLAASIARRLGVKIFVLALGSDEEVMAPVSKNKDGSYRYGMVQQNFEGDQLKKIVNITGGKYYRLREASQFKSMMDEIRSYSNQSIDIIEPAILKSVEQQSYVNLEFWLNMFELLGIKASL